MAIARIYTTLLSSPEFVSAGAQQARLEVRAMKQLRIGAILLAICFCGLLQRFENGLSASERAEREFLERQGGGQVSGHYRWQMLLRELEPPALRRAP